MYYDRNAASTLVNDDRGGSLAFFGGQRPEFAHEMPAVDAIDKLIVDAIAEIASQPLLIEFVIGGEGIGERAPDAMQIGARVGFGIRAHVARVYTRRTHRKAFLKRIGLY